MSSGGEPESPLHPSLGPSAELGEGAGKGGLHPLLLDAPSIPKPRFPTLKPDCYSPAGSGSERAQCLSCSHKGLQTVTLTNLPSSPGWSITVEFPRALSPCSAQTPSPLLLDSLLSEDTQGLSCLSPQPLAAVTEDIPPTPQLLSEEFWEIRSENRPKTP